MKMQKGQLVLSNAERVALAEALDVLERMKKKETDAIGRESLGEAIEHMTTIYESYPEEET